MTKFPLSRTLNEFASVFFQQGYHLFIVGGAVRDYLLGISNHDYDFATDARPDQVGMLFRKVIPTGIEHGTVTVIWGEEHYEVTTFRSDGLYTDMRHPQAIRFVGNLDEDLTRRDFTINAFAVDCSNGEILDKNDGEKDLKKHLIRAIGDPHQRFEEDALRILRALRFAAKLDFDIEQDTFEAMRELRENLRHISKERIHDELVKLVQSDHPQKGLSLMEESHVIDILLPQLAKGRDVQQNGMHDDTVLHHNIRCCQCAADHHYDKTVRMAALFHDIGKSETVAYKKEANTYYLHDSVGEKITREILQDLKASNNEIESVSHLVGNHMFHYTPQWKDSAVRRFINRVGEKELDNLFRLRFCDEEATSGHANYESIRNLDNRIREIIQRDDALSLKDLRINGKDLIQLGIPQGPILGKVLDYLLETVLDDPEENTPKRLAELALAYCSSNFAMPKLS
ncbi:MAG: HDIG domain-containing metalloprotein [Sphaerochaetaceae bacterium]